jgi:hypothetical protein
MIAPDSRSSAGRGTPARRLVAALGAAVVLSWASGFAQAPDRAGQTAPARPAYKGSDPQFRTRLDFNRWHSHEEIKADLLMLEQAFPAFLKYQVIGKSVEGRELMVMTINNPKTGPEAGKPAMYIEANVHGNEIQGAEVCLYTIWYLMEHYDRVADVKRLVDERVFHIVPTVNPDGREHFLNVRSGGRSGHMPVDNDNDGLYDEDDVDDLNGNGVIEQIRKYVPGQGTHRKSALDPRLMEPVPAGTTGDYVMLGLEGRDNDGDGAINEDGPGGYDPNRNWASDWQPTYIQNGSMDYPFQLPEARAIADFMMARPNIAGVQSYHNAGGMILRGPGAEMQGEYPQADVRAYDELGRTGERMLPYYRYLVIWSGLYTVHGGFIDWTNDGLGVLSFSNELWNGGQYFNSPDLKDQQRNPESPIAPRVSSYFFDDRLELGDQFVEWQAFEHPTLGAVEMGGWKHTFGRVPPRFMNEELCHRNMAFTLYQADEMPQIAFGEPAVESMGQGVWRVRLPITNDKLTPTILAQAARNHVVRPDLLTVEGNGVDVLAAGFVRDRFRPAGTDLVDRKPLTRILIRNGHPGRTTRVVEYLVKGGPEMTVTYDSQKGGVARRTIALKAERQR